MEVARRVWDWLDHRLQIGSPMYGAATHPVHSKTASWWYVFGSASLVLFVLQIVTGVLLALVYVPSADQAYRSLAILNYEQPLGWFLRAMHGWGSNFMIAIVLIHMMQVVIFGAYKYPRELTWVVGVFLLLCTLAMAFTGQVLRFDQDSYWGLGIGASIAGRTPWIGEQTVQVLLGGPIIAGATLTRFFTLHVFVIPGCLVGLIGLHVLMVITLGVNEWPMPGRLVRKATYIDEYERLIHDDGVPFVPVAFQKDLLFAGVLLLAVIGCAAVFGPFGPTGEPDPSIIDTVPRPDYFFLWIFGALALLPPAFETPALFIGPIIGILGLLLLPFIAGEGEKSWRRRPVALLTIVTVGVALGVLTRLGQTAPWSPVMNAWSALPVPREYLEGRSALQRQGAVLFQAKQCRNCHALGAEGGLRGPALNDVATRLTADQLIRQILQGRGNMPAYGKNLSPAETTALVAFLESLRPPGLPPATNIVDSTERSSVPSR
jgi:ubiquinol-cytochrome c reductase cytochrome b subunit